MRPRVSVLSFLVFAVGIGPFTYAEPAGENYERDVESYKRIIGTDPDNTEAHYQLALTYDKLGNLYGAIDSYRRVIRIDPEGPRAHLAHISLGVLYIEHGRYPEAIGAFKKAIVLEPTNTMAHYNLGVAYFQRGDRDSALKEYLFIKYRDKELADKLYDLMHGKKVEGVGRESGAVDEKAPSDPRDR